MSEINEGKDIKINDTDDELAEEIVENGEVSNEEIVKDNTKEVDENEFSEDISTKEIKKDEKLKKKDDVEVKKLKKELDELKKKNDEYFQMLQRKAAEFDNFKKRTRKEKDELYKNAFSEAVEIFLPLLDNFDRATEAMSKEDSSKESIREGVEMISKQIVEIIKNAGVEEIIAVGKEFNPEFHNAMMHIEDEKYGENEVVEEFQKGYMFKGKVIRHSTVKVAN